MDKQTPGSLNLTHAVMDHDTTEGPKEQNTNVYQTGTTVEIKDSVNS